MNFRPIPRERMEAGNCDRSPTPAMIAAQCRSAATSHGQRTYEEDRGGFRFFDKKQRRTMPRWRHAPDGPSNTARGSRSGRGHPCRGRASTVRQSPARFPISAAKVLILDERLRPLVVRKPPTCLRPSPRSAAGRRGRVSSPTTCVTLWHGDQVYCGLTVARPLHGPARPDHAGRVQRHGWRAVRNWRTLGRLARRDKYDLSGGGVEQAAQCRLACATRSFLPKWRRGR